MWVTGVLDSPESGEVEAWVSLISLAQWKTKQD